MRCTTGTDNRGFGLLTVLLWLSLLMTTALGVALATSAEPPATSALHDRLRLARAAESAVSLAIASLAAQPDWSLLPGAGVPSPFTDGAPGPRVFAGLPRPSTWTRRRTGRPARTCVAAWPRRGRAAGPRRGAGLVPRR